MANVKISAQSAATTPLDGTEVVAGMKAGSSVKITTQSIADLAGGQGKHAIYISAGSMTPLFTNGASNLQRAEIASTTPNVISIDFGSSTEQYAQFVMVMPKSWNEGTITYKAYWSHAATTTNFGVTWGLCAVAVSDNDAYGAAYGTVISVADTGGTTNNLYVSAESSAMTVAGTPANEDMVVFKVSRVVADAGDTMSINARLMGITIYITTNASTDA